MLPKKRRVTSSMMDVIMKQGRVLYGSFMYVRYIKDNTYAHSLFSVVVPKSVEKTSVGRHSLRRRMNALARPFFEVSQAQVAAVFFLKKEAKIANRQQLLLDIETLCKRL